MRGTILISVLLALCAPAFASGPYVSADLIGTANKGRQSDPAWRASLGYETADGVFVESAFSSLGRFQSFRHSGPATSEDGKTVFYGSVRDAEETTAVSLELGRRASLGYGFALSFSGGVARYRSAIERESYALTYDAATYAPLSEERAVENKTRREYGLTYGLGVTHDVSRYVRLSAGVRAHPSVSTLVYGFGAAVSLGRTP